MYKRKLCGLAIACTMGLIGASPSTVFAADITTESAILAEANTNQKDNKASLDETMKKAEEKWNTLTKKQKEEVYSLMEDQMKAEIKLMNQLAKLGVLPQTDADNFKTHMTERFDKMKKNGEFPFAKPQDNKNGR